jgi:hypothetical protein
MCVVSEGYLGPPHLRFPSPEEQKKIFDLLHAINRKFLSEVSRIIKKGQRIVFCIPFFRTAREKIFYPQNLLDEYAAGELKILSPSRSLLYERENQVVGREIMVFEKK